MTTRSIEFRAISPSRLRVAPGTIGVIVSLLYFGDLFLKASRKCFWYDELFTVYLCRLPDFKHTWAAVMQGADYNPPVLYLFTRGAERVFGEGLIATRLPPVVLRSAPGLDIPTPSWATTVTVALVPVRLLVPKVIWG